MFLLSGLFRLIGWKRIGRRGVVFASDYRFVKLISEDYTNDMNLDDFFLHFIKRSVFKSKVQNIRSLKIKLGKSA